LIKKTNFTIINDVHDDDDDENHGGGVGTVVDKQAEAQRDIAHQNENDLEVGPVVVVDNTQLAQEHTVLDSIH